MPSNLLSIDSNFPSFTGEESPEQQIRALHNYLFQLREGLQYSLRNLTADNFNTAALQNLTDAQKNEVTTQLEKVYTQLNQMSAEIDRLSGRVSGSENLSGRMTAAEGEISLLKNRMDDAETEIDYLDERTSNAESSITDLQETVAAVEAERSAMDERISGVEDALPQLEEAADELAELEDTVTGEGGLQEQMAASQQELNKISGALQVADDGSVTIGSEGKPLHLVGQIYINGVLYEQGGTT